MAVSGTLTGVFSIYGTWEVILTGVTTATNSPPFSGRGMPFSSYGVEGTFGAAGTCQWQGSNDGGANWDNIGVTFTSAQGGTLTPGGTPYKLYQLLVTGGDATTALAAYVSFTKSQ